MSWYITQTQYYGVTDDLDALYTQSKSGEPFYDLYDLIVDERNIRMAYGIIKKNAGSKTSGTNRHTISYIKKMTEDDVIAMVRGRLKDYKPHWVRRVHIPKENGKTRPLGIPMIEDRIIQQCFKQILEPIVEAKFYEHSYGFRHLRSQHHAIERAINLINMGKQYVVDVDIKGFFDNVNHNLLIKQLWNIGIRDSRVLMIIKKMLKAPVVGEGIQHKGTPQGGVLSPLLSNVVLHDLDMWVSDQWEKFESNYPYTENTNKYRKLKKTNLKEGFIVRYADDFKIFTTDHRTAWKWYHAVRLYLKDRLKLDISPEKSQVTNLRRRWTEFLGIMLKADYQPNRKNKQVGISKMIPKKKEKIIDVIREKAVNLSRNPKPEMLLDLNAYIRGVHGYFSVASKVSLEFNEIAWRTRSVLYNRLKKHAIRERDLGMNKGYKQTKQKTYRLGMVQMIVITNVQTKPVPKYSQDLTIYSPESRTKYEIKLKDSRLQRVLAHLNHKGYWRRAHTIEYYDNRLRRVSMSLGECEITGVDLTLDMKLIHCHHVVPKEFGGTDDYDNLRIVHRDIHRLIHAKRDTTIERYLSKFCLTEKALKKINSLRKSAGLKPIKISKAA